MADASRFKVPRFEDYPAVQDFRGAPAKADLTSHPLARRYRTMLTQQSQQGIDFAGHFSIAGWGCGSSCLQFAIVDAQTGRVYFAPGLETLHTVHVDEHPGEAEPEWSALRYRKDSRLLVVLGAPNEEMAREGIAYYEWDGSKLKLVRFLKSAKEWCNDG